MAVMAGGYCRGISQVRRRNERWHGQTGAAGNRAQAHGGASIMSLTLCVLLWATPGGADGLICYEDRVLSFLAGHGGEVVARARGGGADGQPLEIQTLRFPSAQAVEAFMADPRRQALSADRDRSVGRTEIIEVDLVAGGGTGTGRGSGRGTSGGQASPPGPSGSAAR
jgi:uncharacterized protein (DUF1330 family)